MSTFTTTKTDVGFFVQTSVCTLTDAPSVRVRRGQTAAPTTAGVRTLHRTRTSVTSGEFFDTVRCSCLVACCFFAWKQKWTFCIGAVVADARCSFSIGPRCLVYILSSSCCCRCQRIFPVGPMLQEPRADIVLALCCRSPEQILHWPYVAGAQSRYCIGPMLQMPNVQFVLALLLQMPSVHFDLACVVTGT